MEAPFLDPGQSKTFIYFGIKNNRGRFLNQGKISRDTVPHPLGPNLHLGDLSLSNFVILVEVTLFKNKINKKYLRINIILVSNSVK